MSEYITHVAVHDDCRALVLSDERTAPELRRSLERHPRASRLGSITSLGDQHTVELLQHARSGWPGVEAERRLAFMFGWRCHLAADRQLKALFRLLEPDVYITEALDGPTDASIYQDVFLLREVYEGQAPDPSMEGILASDHPARPVEDLFIGQWRNKLFNLHTLPEGEAGTPAAWMEAFQKRRQLFYVALERYDDAYADTDAEMMRYVVEEHRFYDHNNALIRLARSIQQGAPHHSIDLDDALEAARSASHYARALRRGVRYARATSAFWAGTIDVDELSVRFDVDKPHTPREVFGALDDPERRNELLREWHESGPQ